MLKEFEEERWAQYDAPAKTVAIQFWQKLGYDCVENPDEFGVDLLVEGKGKRFACEVEVKTGWHGGEFQFPTLHIAMRKRKFMDRPCQFIVLNKGLTHAAVVGRKTVLASPVVEVANAVVPSGERFYDVPTKGLAIINLMAGSYALKDEFIRN